MANPWVLIHTTLADTGCRQRIVDTLRVPDTQSVEAQRDTVDMVLFRQDQRLMLEYSKTSD